MRLRKITRRGEENWDRLDRKGQFAVLKLAIDKITVAGNRADISVDIISIGMGFRVRSTRVGKRTYWKEPCLKLTVRTKKPTAKLDQSRLIPDRVQLSLYGGYSSRVYAIPIDVEVEKPVPRAQGPQAILCTDNRTRVSGSYCALVHDDTGQNYLLTCHHVAALSLQDLSSHRVPTFSYIEDLLAGITAGAHLADQFGPDIDFAIDAALIQILDPAVLEELLSPSRWHVPVVDYVRSEAELMDMSDRRMNLLSRHRRRLPCRLKTMYQNKEVAYGARGVRTRIFQLAEFTLTTADTAAGYSGGGVVATDGTLLAMHIAGVGNISYAIPAYLLIDSGLLRTPVALGPV